MRFDCSTIAHSRYLFRQLPSTSFSKSAIATFRTRNVRSIDSLKYTDTVQLEFEHSLQRRG
jgi:hypothetical protein